MSEESRTGPGSISVEEYRDIARANVRLGLLKDAMGKYLNEGRFWVLEKLGEGAFSTVWLCRDNETESLTAVKTLSARLSGRRTKKEFKLLTKIHSIDDPLRERIIKPRSEFVHLSPLGKHYSMSFEYMQRDLDCLIENAMLPLAMVKHMTTQVLEGLDFLHTKCKVIHSDLKPDNILFSGLEDYYPPRVEGMMTRLELANHRTLQYPRVNFKISDFGNSVEMTEKSRVIKQARPYRAFELILGAYDNPSMDIWSMGCIVFEAATGYLLFDVTNDGVDADSRHLREFCKILGEIPKALLIAYRKRVNMNQLEAVDPFKNLPGLLQYPEEAQGFREFLMPMFNYLWTSRVKAADCLKAPWLQS